MVLSAAQERIGVFVRLLEIDLSDERQTREYAYALDDPHGLNELVTLDDGGFIVLEKDGKKGREGTLPEAVPRGPGRGSGHW